ncbi:MAG: High-affnity carbon uptake protein Hat/HatR [Raineya sp.]|jgi:WD40 repeat protein|nr:High-affnity carbon uptake protein Hat/HatR [Raineya sp.]
MKTLNLDFDKKSEKEVIKNPFPGLRPFKYEESHLYFGRENQIDEVLDKLVQNRFVSIIGTSGIGKSSFIYCGIFPVLYGDYPTDTSSKWEIFTMRPGVSPIKNLAKALVHNELINFEDSEKNSLSENIEYALLTKDSNGLIDSIRSKYQQFPRNYLIFIDQFEEIFRFKDIDTHSHEETLAFIKLIANAVYQSEVPIYVALTMRSDFVGDCSQYPYLTKLVNDSQFLIPQMTRNEKREAIMGPVKVMNGTIDEALTQKILNDIGDSTDQLPIMQHALMRTWDYWQRTTSGKDAISITDYEAIGGMSQALSIHANEAYNELDEKQKRICEKLFRTITEKSTEGRGVRRPTKLKEIASIADASNEEVIEVINHFRSPERTLLMPPFNVNLDGETVIDISHESLMRIWVTLNKWVEEEAESSKSYLRLAENAEKHQQGKNSLLRSPDLQIALNWREEEKPTLLWGLRYHPAYERTMLYLDFSQKEFEREQKNKEKQQKRRIFLTRLIAGIFGLGGIVAVLLLLLAEEQRQLAEKKTIEAEQQSKEALKQKKLAEDQAKEAEKQRKNAAEQSKLAQLESERAKEQAALAEAQRRIALTKEEEAKKQADIARSNARLAELQGQIAKEKGELAMKAEAEAKRQQRLSIARSMAVKSLQEPDSVRKALMAQQAYNFHSRNGGYEKDYDIYDGLYYALKSIKGEFNRYNVHSANVRSFVSNPNNNYMYSAGSDGKIVRWDPRLDNVIPQVVISSDKVHRAVAISPDNKYLAYAGDYSFINLYELNNLNGKPRILKTNTYQIWYLAFTNDDKLISVGKDNKVLEWDGAVSKEIMTSNSKINDVTVNPINGLIAIGKSDGTVVQIDRATKTQQIIYQHPTKIATSAIEFSPDGRWLVVGSEDGTLALINQQTQNIETLTKHRAQVNNIAFNPKNSNMLATGSWDGTVKIWNLSLLKESPIVLRDHYDWVWSIAFSPDGEKIFAGCKDLMVRAWPTRASKLAEMLCKEIKRNMTETEWSTFVGKDIPYENTCDK